MATMNEQRRGGNETAPAEESRMSELQGRLRGEAPPAVVATAAEVRCHCGSLLARVIADRIELKCRRCKRVVVVAANRARQGWVAVRGHRGIP